MMVPASDRSLNRLPVIAALLLFAGCASSAVEMAERPAPSGAITDPTHQVVTSPYGAVSSASRLATEAGAEVLARGGNAVDAAVATAFVLTVTEPSMSGLGGRASTIIRTPDGRVHGIDGLNQVPAGYADGGSPGYERAAVPGVPAALGRALEQFGTWPLERVLEPAICLAGEGYLLEEDEAARFLSTADDLRRYPGARDYFLKPDGSPYQPGDLFIQEDLARTLRTIAEEGIDAFYRGPIADAIHEDMAANGGFITRTDLAGYEALPAILVRGEYRGHPLVSNFRPAAGHAVIEALHIIETLGPAPAGDSAEYASIAGQAMRIAISDRGRRFGDESQSARRITSKEWAAERAREIDLSGPAVGALTYALPQGELTPRAPDEDNTTHLSVMDASGMVVAHTQSLGPTMGTRVATPGLGFLYATRLGSTPGSRPSSTISPTILFSPEGTPLLAVGCAGNDRIITAIVQVISHIVDHGMTLEEAMAAPRVHPAGGRRLRLESGGVSSWPETVRAALEEAGFEVVAAPSRDFGRVHAVWFDPATGLFTGVAEPRWDGGAAAPRVGVTEVGRR